jgi:hypothetical protein
MRTCGSKGAHGAHLDALSTVIRCLAQKSAEDVMKEQEAMLMAKYGGLQPKKKKGALGPSKVQ